MKRRNMMKNIFSIIAIMVICFGTSSATKEIGQRELQNAIKEYNKQIAKINPTLITENQDGSRTITYKVPGYKNPTIKKEYKNGSYEIIYSFDIAAQYDAEKKHLNLITIENHNETEQEEPEANNRQIVCVSENNIMQTTNSKEQQPNFYVTLPEEDSYSLCNRRENTETTFLASTFLASTFLVNIYPIDLSTDENIHSGLLIEREQNRPESQNQELQIETPLQMEIEEELQMEPEENKEEEQEKEITVTDRAVIALGTGTIIATIPEIIAYLSGNIPASVIITGIRIGVTAGGAYLLSHTPHGTRAIKKAKKTVKKANKTVKRISKKFLPSRFQKRIDNHQEE